MYLETAAPLGMLASIGRHIGTPASKVVGAATFLFHEGDRADKFYEVLSGVYRAVKVFPDGRRQVVAFAYPGDIIGFGHGQTYRFDCFALTPGQVRVLSREDIFATMRDRPELGERLLAVAAGEIATMQDLSILLCRKAAIERIAGFLVSLAQRTGRLGNECCVKLPMCRADIADHLGLTIETVSRNMTKLRVREIIDFPNRGSFVIRDLARLESLAACEDDLH